MTQTPTASDGTSTTPGRGRTNFVIEFETDHPALVGAEGDLEVARILGLVSDMVTHGGIVGGSVPDPDGNTIGKWRYWRAHRPAAPSAE